MTGLSGTVRSAVTRLTGRCRPLRGPLTVSGPRSDRINGMHNDMTDAPLPARDRLAIFTVVSNNYLHFARTLLQSVARHHPEADLYCVIVDSDPGPSGQFADDFRILVLQDLNIPDLMQMAFQYDVLELNTAVKPWAFEALLDKGYGSIVYLDPDIFVYRPLGDITAPLAEGSDIVITPHLLSPIRDDKRPTELDIRRAGTYNFGFCALGSSDMSREFLRWWQAKLIRDCIVDMDRGIFVDQSWIDLVPGLFDNVFILRNPAYNVAYWNIAQRAVTRAPDGRWAVDGEPLAFFHFSGFNPLKPEPFSKHQNRFTLASLGLAEVLARDYAAAVIANGAERFSKLAYGFATFSDGTSIPADFRRLYLQNESLRARMGDDPFQRSDILVQPAEGPGVASLRPITWTMYSVYKHRADLRSAFDLLDPEGSSRFWTWFLADPSTGITASLRDLHRQKQTAANGPLDAAEIVCLRLFAEILDRPPTRREFETLFDLCKTRLGASVALVRLSRTAESRNRPRPTRRFKAAMRTIWSAHGKTILPPAAIAGPPPRSSSKVLAGLYPPEPDSPDSGIWCGPELSVPLGNGTHGRIGICGLVYPSFVHRMNPQGVLSLDLKLDGQFWKRVEFPESGVIDIDEPVPEHFAGASTLEIGADGIYVPSAHNTSLDHRHLSWRVKEIRTDERTIVDCTRDQPFLPMLQMFGTAGFNLVGYIYAELGVGEAARTMAGAARAAAIPYSLLDVGYQTENRQTDRRADAGAVDRTFGIDILYVNADQTQNTLRYLAGTGRPKAPYRIGFWHWEQPRLPEVYWQGFEGLDEVWVPTAFVQEAVSAVSPVPVFKVPHAVDFRVSPDWTRESFGIPADRFAVLVMYDFHSYRVRKNPEAAIAAFERASAGREDMVLVIKTINASGYAEDYAALKAEVAGTSVVFIDEVFSRDQIYALEACCDCMLSLHRAEGFGFGPAEMMFLGKPVIATGWSGNMEFMTPHNSFPVDYELVPLKAQLGAYAAGIDWAEPDVDHAAACLRRVVEDRALAREVGARARQTMLTKFSPAVIGQHYRERLALIGMRL